MSRNPKGFYMSLPSISRYGVPNDIERGISFQLTADGARYFFVEEVSGKRSMRDISTHYQSLSRTRYDGNMLWLGVENNKEAHERLRAHAHHFFPESVIPEKDEQNNPYPWVAFPMIGAAMKSSGLGAPPAANLQIARGLRAFTVRDMTERLFGEAPKQLQAAVAESLVKNPGGVNPMGRRLADKPNVNLDNLTLASLFRGYLPADYMVEILGMDLPLYNGMIRQTDKITANQVRLLTRRFNHKRLMRLVQSLATDPRALMYLHDAASAYAQTRRLHPDTVIDLSRQFKSFDEVHSTIYREYQKLKNPNEKITYSDNLTERLESIELSSGAKVIWPSCTYDLLDWASDSVMSNCIYSYGSGAVSGRSLLLAILDPSGKMIINMEIRSKNIMQCYGPANAIVTDEALLENLFEKLIDADIVSPENDPKTWLRRRMW